MGSDMENYLNRIIEEFPSRASGEDLYEHLRKVSKPLVEKSREDFSTAMMKWLALRSEPKTMLAVELIGIYQLSELDRELEILRKEISEGLVFKSFYVKEIDKIRSLI